MKRKMVKHLQKDVARLESELKTPAHASSNCDYAALLRKKDLQIEKEVDDAWEFEDPMYACIGWPSTNIVLGVGISLAVAEMILLLLMIFIPSKQDDFVVPVIALMIFSFLSFGVVYHRLTQPVAAAAPLLTLVPLPPFLTLVPRPTMPLPRKSAPKPPRKSVPLPRKSALPRQTPAAAVSANNVKGKWLLWKKSRLW